MGTSWQVGNWAGLEICSQHWQLEYLKVVFMHVFANHESKNYFISPHLDSFSSHLIVYHNSSYETTGLFDWSFSVSVVVVWLSNITDMCNTCCCQTCQIDYPGSYRDGSTQVGCLI
jgi:hypothetical protein